MYKTYYFFFDSFSIRAPLHKCRVRCFCVELFSGGGGVGAPAAATATANLYIKHSCPCVYTRYVDIYGSVLSVTVEER